MAAILEIVIFLLIFALIYVFAGVISNRQMLNQVLLGLDNPKKKEITNILTTALIIAFGFLILDLIHVFLIFFNWWDETVTPPATWAEVSPYVLTELILVIGFLIFELLVVLYYQNYMKEYYLTQ
ncbi:MAG: hypothetical protein EAX96_13810 [Candidatus Lokiarchaeota archaeon]|nr:hypothetical protein [Candidatus Lokiarchaeota archaeon]